MEVVGCVELYLIVRGMGRVFLSVDGNDAKVAGSPGQQAGVGALAGLFNPPNNKGARSKCSRAKCLLAYI